MKIAELEILNSENVYPLSLALLNPESGYVKKKHIFCRLRSNLVTWSWSHIFTYTLCKWHAPFILKLYYIKINSILNKNYILHCYSNTEKSWSSSKTLFQCLYKLCKVDYSENVFEYQSGATICLVCKKLLYARIQFKEDSWV